MNIADELRELVTGAKPSVVDGCWVNVGSMTYGCKEALLAIADRIDAEHEAMLVDARKTVYQGYIELPKDADGEYIHVGDMLADGLSQDFAPKKVKMLMLEGNEWMLNFGAGWQAMKNHEWHHHAPDTWERIIEDARAYVMNISGSHLWKNKTDELVARCKALAGGEQ